MNAAGTQTGRAESVEAQALATVRQLLHELGGTRGLDELAARGTKSHLERDLGLGSLERVELMLRLNEACGVQLPEHAMVEANTVEDVIEAVRREETARQKSPRTRTLEISEPKADVPHGAVAGETPASKSPEFEQRVRRAESLTEVIRLRGLGEPGRAHIHLYDDQHQIHTITCGELYERGSNVAGDLRRRGLQPGQTVAIMLPTCAEFYYTFAGILLGGGIPVPIYPPFRADRIAEYATRQANILSNAECRFLVTFRQAEGLANLLKPRVSSLREVLNAEKLSEGTPPSADVPPTEWRAVENLAHHASGNDIAFLQYTSGSTGAPKGVTLTHSNLLANIWSMIAAVEAGPGDLMLTWLPLYHDMGLIGAWMAPLCCGMPVAVMSPLAFLSRPARWLQAIHRHRATLSPAPNFAYELSVRKITEPELEGVDLSCWRAALNGAEPVRAETLEKFATRFAGHGFRREALMPVYGLAEGTLAIAIPKCGRGYRVDRIERDTFESQGRAVLVPPTAPTANDRPALEFVGAGKPLRDVEVRIVANGERDAGEREEGQLWFRSAGAMRGYYRNPEATQQVMRGDGWLDSGDLAYVADGEIFITGRVKDIIIKGGRKLYPHEIEDVSGRVAGVRTGCVVAFGAPDARSGTERLVVAAEVRRGESAGAQKIVAEITRVVNDAMGAPPDLVELLPPQSIPKTSSGKLRRSETRRLYLEGKLGKKVAPAWAQVGKLAVRSAAPRAWAAVKRIARRGAEIVYGAYALSMIGLGIGACWVSVVLTSDRKRAAARVKTASNLTLKLAGIPVSEAGREILSRMNGADGWIFAPNHSSYIDILVTLGHLPANAHFVSKGEALSMPLLGTMLRRAGHFAFNRSDPEARIRQAEQLSAALESGDPVVIYPEGTFTAITGIRPFQLGAFKAAVDTQRPVCPVAIRGARQVLRDKTILPRPGRITITYGPLVVPNRAAGDDWHEIVRLRDETREIIARGAGEPLL
ncbi:MAG TPA: AMP-binding protein [Candidatus Dormibacteraeota bacterium]|nr:AMP-binding protein [Candidatus Dormibacteraeota bacterium]